MNELLKLVVCTGLLTWVLILAASLIRVNGWTPRGMLIAFGNRESLPEPSAFAGRAERTARNTLENFVLFAALALVANAAGAAANPKVLQGAQLFFWSRVAFVPAYYAGIPYLRTAIWGASIAGMAMIVMAL